MFLFRRRKPVFRQAIISVPFSSKSSTDEGNFRRDASTGRQERDHSAAVGRVEKTSQFVDVASGNFQIFKIMLYTFSFFRINWKKN